MPLSLPAIADLDPDLVAQEVERINTTVQEDNAHLDLRFGPFRGLLVYYQGVMAAQLRTNVAQYLSARSLQAIEADPALAAEDVVDDVFSNFRATRGAGSRASGEVAVVRDTDTTLTVPAGAIFDADGLVFRTDRVYTAKAEAAQINSDSDRLITRTADGRHLFTVTVVADEAGEAGRLAQDTLITPRTRPVGYLTSYAAGDFSGGRSPETNEAMLRRLQEGIAAPTVSNRGTMAGLLRQTPPFDTIVAQLVVGLGNPEMRRDARGLFPIHYGGRLDWYVRGEPRVNRTTLRKDAVLLEATDDGRGVWQVSLGRDDAPGFYDVAVRPAGAEAGAGSFEVTLDQRGVDVSGLDPEFVPDVDPATAEGVYSRYQTAVVRFADTVTPTAGLEPGATNPVDVVVRHTALVGELQDYMSDPAHWPPGADVLVKGAVPCFVQVSLTVHKSPTQSDPDVDAVVAALCAAVNAVGFTGRLYGSQLLDAAHGALEAGVGVADLDMLGAVRYPDGEVRYIRSGEVLSVPDDAARMVSARTVQFYLDPADVSVSVTTTLPAGLA